MALSFNSFGNTPVVTNSTTAVDIVAAPASSVFRVVRCITIFNADVVSATVTIQLNVSGTIYILAQAVLATGQTFEFGDGNFFCVLDATTKKLQVVLSGAVATNQLPVVANFGDYA